MKVAAIATMERRFLAVFFAAQGDAFKAFELPHHLLDACAAPVERFGEVPGNVAPV
jgi:hypothetical protein